MTPGSGPPLAGRAERPSRHRRGFTDHPAGGASQPLPVELPELVEPEPVPVLSEPVVEVEAVPLELLVAVEVLLPVPVATNADFCMNFTLDFEAT